MATTVRRRQAEDFDIHEDAPSTQDTEMITDGVGEEEAEDEEGYADQEEQVEEELEQELEEEDEDDMSEEEALDDDMMKLQDAYPGFKYKYRLIKRIGEGMCPSICPIRSH